MGSTRLDSRRRTKAASRQPLKKEKRKKKIFFLFRTLPPVGFFLFLTLSPFLSNPPPPLQEGRLCVLLPPLADYIFRWMLFFRSE